MSENELPSMVDEAEESFMPISVINTSACQMTEMSANYIERLIEDNKYLSNKVSELQKKIEYVFIK